MWLDGVRKAMMVYRASPSSGRHLAGKQMHDQVGVSCSVDLPMTLFRWGQVIDYIA